MSSRSLALLGAVALLGACGRPVEEERAQCRVRMIDKLSSIDTVLQIKEVEASHYIATDRIGTTDPWSVELTILPDGRIDVDASVPAITLDQLLKQYVMADTRQLTFSPVSGHDCSVVERSLLYFLVLEWFYFG